MLLPLKDIDLDVELQPREDIDRELVAEYAEQIMTGAEFPPVVVFRNGSAEHLLADGWHRYYAHQILKRTEIAAEIREGDHEAALRYSLGANATHGRQRSETTIKRAYAKAVKAGLVDGADVDAVRDLLQIGQRTAEELTEDARAARKEAAKSIAMALAARGVSQRKIAERLGVPQQTISDWLTDPRTHAETGHPEALPSEADLDAIAEEIKAAARKDVLPDVRAELKLELDQRIAKVKEQLEDAIRQERDRTAKERERRLEQSKRSEELVAKLKLQLAATKEASAQASDEAARKAAEKTEKALRKEIEKAEAGLARERAALEKQKTTLERQREELEAAQQAPLAETEEEATEREQHQTLEAGKRLAAKLSGPACDGWFKVLQAIDAIKEIDLGIIEANPYPQFERQAIAEATVAMGRLRAAFGVATRSAEHPDEQA